MSLGKSCQHQFCNLVDFLPFDVSDGYMKGLWADDTVPSMQAAVLPRALSPIRALVRCAAATFNGRPHSTTVPDV
jgi:hypothetical protein